MYKRQGITGWRLPSAKLIGNTADSNDGSTDGGYNNLRSEMGRMYYLYLGNLGSLDINGNSQDVGSFKTSLIDSVSIENLKSGYWLDEERADKTNVAWAFLTNQSASQGLQNDYVKLDPNPFGWAVHDGDVTDSATE